MRLIAILSTFSLGLAVSRTQAQAAGDLSDLRDLPLIEVPSRGDGDAMAILLTGDGGWASIDKDIAGALSNRGVPVVGMNLKDYLGKERSPDETAAAVARVVRVYRQRWNRHRVIIVGFSRGANVAPFAVARLPDDIRPNIALVALIGLARAANFKWHLQDVFREVKRPSDLPVRPELDRMRDVRTICVFGADEKESGCRDTPPEVTRIERPGGHHMDGNYKAVADIVLDALRP